MPWQAEELHAIRVFPCSAVWHPRFQPAPLAARRSVGGRPRRLRLHPSRRQVSQAGACPSGRCAAAGALATSIPPRGAGSRATVLPLFCSSRMVPHIQRLPRESVCRPSCCTGTAPAPATPWTSTSLRPLSCGAAASCWAPMLPPLQGPTEGMQPAAPPRASAVQLQLMTWRMRRRQWPEAPRWCCSAMGVCGPAVARWALSPLRAGVRGGVLAWGGVGAAWHGQHGGHCPQRRTRASLNF